MNSIVNDQHEIFVNQEVSCSQCATHFVKEIDFLAVDRDAIIKDLGELHMSIVFLKLAPFIS